MRVRVRVRVCGRCVYCVGVLTIRVGSDCWRRVRGERVAELQVRRRLWWAREERELRTFRVARAVADALHRVHHRQLLRDRTNAPHSHSLSLERRDTRRAPANPNPTSANPQTYYYFFELYECTHVTRQFACELTHFVVGSQLINGNTIH